MWLNSLWMARIFMNLGEMSEAGYVILAILEFVKLKHLWGNPYPKIHKEPSTSRVILVTKEKKPKVRFHLTLKSP